MPKITNLPTTYDTDPEETKKIEQERSEKLLEKLSDFEQRAHKFLLELESLCKKYNVYVHSEKWDSELKVTESADTIISDNSKWLDISEFKIRK